MTAAVGRNASRNESCHLYVHGIDLRDSVLFSLTLVSRKFNGIIGGEIIRVACSPPKGFSYK